MIPWFRVMYAPPPPARARSSVGIKNMRVLRPSSYALETPDPGSWGPVDVLTSEGIYLGNFGIRGGGLRQAARRLWQHENRRHDIEVWPKDITYLLLCR